MEQEEISKIEKTLLNSNPTSPFTSIVSNCRQQLNEVKNSILFISLYGETKAGKSTLGNCLVNEQHDESSFPFPSAYNPTTTCPCIVHSGHLDSNRAGFALFENDVQTADDIQSIFGKRDPTLVDYSFIITVYIRCVRGQRWATKKSAVGAGK